MKVCVCHLPNGACVLKRSPFGAQPVRLVSLVLVDVSSMKISRGKALLKKRFLRPVHNSRAWRTSARCCSLASRVFFMTEPQALEQAPDIGAVHARPTPLQLDAKLIQCQFAGLDQPQAD